MSPEPSIALVTSELPNTSFGGGALTAYAILESLVKEGLAVHLFTWPGTSGKRDPGEIERLTASVTFLNPIIRQPLLRRFFGREHSFFPHAAASAELSQHLRARGIAAIVTYHWEALAAVAPISGIPKFALVGDPVNLPYLFRLKTEARGTIGSRFAALFKRVPLTYLSRRLQREMVTLLNAADESGAFAAHHAEMLTRWGARECRYYRTPLPDPRPPQKRTTPLKPRILLLGHLKGVATLSGIELFVAEIYPRLRQLLGGRNFEVHVVGGFHETLPRRLKRGLARDEIRLRGHLSPCDEEFVNAHALLVPTPIELGIRVRIITAFSFATPVVTHVANSKGIPELSHKKNCLIGSRGRELAEHCARIIEDRALREELSRGARETYLAFFSIEKAGVEIARRIGELIPGGTTG